MHQRFFGNAGTPKPGSMGQLDMQTMSAFMQQANGDKDKARQMARDAGYSF